MEPLLPQNHFGEFSGDEPSRDAFDRRVTSAMRSLSVPAGLKDRLLEAVVNTSIVNNAVVPTLDAGARAAHPAAEVPTPSRMDALRYTSGVERLTRRAVAWSGVVAALLLLAPLGWFYFPHSWSAETLVRAASDFHHNHPREALTLAPGGSEWSPWIATSAVRGQASVADFLGVPAVAVELKRRGAQGTLYVARLEATGLPDAPPSPAAGGEGSPDERSVIAWREGDLIFILVCEAGERPWQVLLNRRIPLA